MKRISWLLLIPALLFGLLPGYRAQAQAAPRKGWSPQAKNAAIGGAAGVLGGALINGRNRKVGGLIGGLAGAGVGYAIGKRTDNKQKAAAAAAAQEDAAREQAAADAQAAAAAEHSVAAQASTTERAAASKRTAATQASARVVANRASATRAAAEHRRAAEQRAEASPPQGNAPAVADLAVAAGYFPNPGFEQAGSPYPASAVLRKSW